MADMHIRIPLPKVSFAPPVYACARAPYPLVPDGDLEKDFWKGAPFTEEFRDIEGPGMPLPRFATRAKLLWDNDNLYIGAVLEGSEIWAHQTEHDCVIFYDNDFEIFIDPDSDTHEYVEYEMNALNTNWDLLLTKPYRDGGSPINALEVKGLSSAVKICGKLNEVSPENRYWSVEVVIPFTTLAECSRTRKAPEPGSFYRLNFSRVQWKVDEKDGTWVKRTDLKTGRPLPEDNWVWAPTGVINIHYPELWGYVFFCDDEHHSTQIPAEEKVKWELRRLYYAEHLHFDLNGCFTADKDKLYELLRQYSPCAQTCAADEPEDLQIAITPGFFELRAAVPDSDREIVLFADGKVIVP